MKKVIVFLATGVLASSAFAYGSVGAGSSGPSDSSLVMKWRGNPDTPIGHVQKATIEVKKLKADYRKNVISQDAFDAGMKEQMKVFDRYGYLPPSDY